MPRVTTLKSGAAIYIYYDDHGPPRIHVRGPQSNAQIRIDDLQVMAGAISRDDYVEAVAYAADHSDVLVAKWREFNERD